MTGRGGLLALLLVEAAAAPIAAAVAGAFAARAARSLRPLAAIAAGAIVLPLAAALAAAERAALAGPAAAGGVYVAALASGAGLLAAALGRRGGAPSLGALAALVPTALLWALIFAAGPLFTVLPGLAALLPAILRLSPVTVLAGSLLDVDVLRTAPLYGLARFGADVPFAYAPPAAGLAAPFALALGGALALRFATPGAAPAVADHPRGESRRRAI